MAALKSILSSRVSKWMGHTIATIFLQRSYCQTYSGYHTGWGFVFQQDGALAHRARDTVAFLERKVPDFVSPTLWSQNSWDLNPDDYNILSVGLMQEKVHRSRIAKVNELEMRVIDDWGRVDQSIVDVLPRPVAPSSQRLCPRSGAHFEHQTKSFSYFVMYLLKVIKLMEIG